MSKTAHSGGTATTEKKAVCTVCGTAYGELAKPAVPPETEDDGGYKQDPDEGVIDEF